MDRFERGLLALFAALSMWVLALDLWQVVVHDRVWTGTDGLFIVDQMQYLAWIQSASHHLLASNLFVLRSTPSDYFQPAVAISGVIAALGLAPWLSLLIWKPVAVIGIFLATRAYAVRSVEGTLARRAVLTLGLLFGSFSVVFGSFGVVGDMMSSFLSWGYPFGLMALALIMFALLGYDRARSAGRVAWSPGLLGAVASALHPWQGELLILILAGAELVRWRECKRSWRSLALPVVTVLLTGLPLVYYALLGHLDLSWNLARQASRHTFPFWSIAVAAAPLALFAVVGYRGRPRDFVDLITRVWPLASLVIYLLSASALSATPLHAFTGITVPLSVLAVQGVLRTGLPRLTRARQLGALAVALGTIPANVCLLVEAPAFVAPSPGNANFITRDERDALAFLNRDPDQGGVLTQFYLGEAVPGRTGRHTLVGDCLWSEPRCFPRSMTADALFDGSLPPPSARQFVRQSGARFVLASCKTHVDLASTLGPMLLSVRDFGCARIYELGAPGTAEGPLAELPSHAAVRAPRRQ